MLDILHKIAIKSSSPDKLYQAVATREGVAAWWTEDTKGESKVGGTLKFSFTRDGEVIGVMEMKVLELRPAERVSWQVVAGPADWIGTRISFELKQEGDYSILLFKHQGWQEASESMHHCSTKWGVFMLSLKSLLETGKGLPSPHDTKIDNWN